ncbi:hypothetical protein K2Z83_20635 [Oscillochloris sp. ZM17-4]|uniref:hypothetical protein n=1 Tax=Oscillochloris sp. ZM17-4 TaxID=2866714 RepID=UPI001C72CEB3|nr:hypothetical protein [Oscillochloris sp. ZM17-4]MBX0330078.1 hypothetical protein [Oscillochloris sp. ZM17-4]
MSDLRYPPSAHNHFHYPGGGFPLVGVSYRLELIAQPTVPTADRIKHMLSCATPTSLQPTRDQITAELAKTSAAYPAAVDGWERAPYKITVYTPGDPAPHILRYQHAARFLRDLGVLRHCQQCRQWTISHEPQRAEGVIICDRCGYVAEDWL